METKQLTEKDRQAIQRANASRWEDIDESWAQTEAGRNEVHRIMTRKYHRDEHSLGIL